MDQGYLDRVNKILAATSGNRTDYYREIRPDLVPVQSAEPPKVILDIDCYCKNYERSIQIGRGIVCKNCGKWHLGQSRDQRRNSEAGSIYNAIKYAIIRDTLPMARITRSVEDDILPEACLVEWINDFVPDRPYLVR